MPKKVVLLDNFEYTIQQELMKSITKDITQKLLLLKDVQTFYVSNYEDNNLERAKNTYDNNKWLDYLEVYIDKTTNDMEMSTTILREYYNMYFYDKDVGLRIHPITYQNRYNIRFKYFTSYRNKLVKLINTLKASTINDSAYMQHMVNYFFTIPTDLLLLLKNIYNLKTGKDDYYTYLKNIAQVPIDFINSRTKEYQIPVIREQQGIYGNFNNDFLDINKIEKEDSGYYIELEYTIDIELPTSLLVIYPLVVCNKPIDDKFIPKIDRPMIIPGANKVVDATWLMNRIKYAYDYANLRPILSYPEQDDFTPSVPQYPDTVRLLTILVTISENDKRTLANLNDVLSFIVNNDFKEYILNHPHKEQLTKLYEDIVYIELFENEYPRDGIITIDSNNNIIATEDLDICKTYRIALNIVYNIDAINLPIRETYTESYLNKLSNVISSLNIDPEYTQQYRVLIEMISYIMLDS